MTTDRFNLSTLLDRHLDAGLSDKAALYSPHGPVTYAELYRNMCAMGRALHALGIQREQRVLLVLDDSPAFFTAFLGVGRIGAVPVPINCQTSPEQVRFYTQDSYARAAVIDADRYEELAPALEEVGVRVISTEPAGPDDGTLNVRDLIRAHRGDLGAAPTHAEDPALWLYSSGSTGRPKGVVHLQRDITPVCRQYAGDVLGVTQDDVHLSTTKLFHAYGLGNSLLFPLWFGGTALLMPGFPAPHLVLETIERARPTLLFSVPALYNAMPRSPGARHRDVSSIRLCVSAAETLPAHVWKRWHDLYGLTILDGVGSTEMLHVYCSNTERALRPGSSGRAVPGYQIKLVDPDGRDVEGAGSGEMFVRGDSMLAHYWHRADQTRSVLQGSWYRTGDRYHRDEDGYYWYEGRADDMMKVSGLWVAPAAIEATLQRHPDVVEAAVVGVETDRLTRIKAFIVLRDGCLGDDALARELRRWCKDRLAGHQFPHLVEFVADLPKTPTGKVQRFALRAQETVKTDAPAVHAV
ncbi:MULTISPECIES: benzoate-CoA ligase family protein [Streptomyces]|uniref:Benzoate-CoA ligase family protein n=2 Tax=Streptomyces TaxID=1883 RepID=A0ABT9KK87_9ACTN|nr:MULTISPECIES: benzoate-CoA ligase family protein [Streptomyces]AKE48665.1 putative aryl-CoA ligase [Streptomyces sp. SH-62]MDP9607957.1 benzoate-CoA ligase family protein [Streptomyces demainii]